MSKLNFCAKLCNECPFSNQSVPGWLAEYSIADFSMMQNSEQLFPCHMMQTDDLTNDEVIEKIEIGELKLCRGYVESLVKSCKMPKFNNILLEARKIVKEQGLSENSMSMHQFQKYHS